MSLNEFTFGALVSHDERFLQEALYIALWDP